MARTKEDSPGWRAYWSETKGCFPDLMSLADIVWGSLLKGGGKVPTADSNPGETGDSDWSQMAHMDVENPRQGRPFLLLRKMWRQPC